MSRVKINFKKGGNPMYWSHETKIGKTVVTPLYENILIYNQHAVDSEWGYVLNDREKTIISKIERETEKAIAVRVGVVGGRDYDEALANFLLWIPKSSIESIEKYPSEHVLVDIKSQRCALDYY